MAKPELGTKRVCPVTGKKFYDLNKNPVISPYTGQVVPIEAVTARLAARAGARCGTGRSRGCGGAGGRIRVPGRGRRGGLRAAARPADGEEEVEVDDEPLDDAAFIVPEEDEDDDVADIIGSDIEDEEEL